MAWTRSTSRCTTTAPRVPAPFGIAERVALYGGELTMAGAREGGQSLRAHLPLGSAA